MIPNKQYLGFNSWGNFGVNSRTSVACGVGRLRNTIASTTRIYNHCNKTSANPLACTFNMTTQTYTIPSSPVMTSILSGNSQLTVLFTPPTNNGGRPILDYEYSIDNGTTFTSAAVTSSPLLIESLTNGDSYDVVIRAVNSVGVGSSSNMLSGIPSTIPSPPTSLTVTNGNSQAIIGFTAGSNGGSSITDYLYSIDNGLTYLSSGVAVSPVTITGLTNGDTYTITLKAVNANGNSAASNAVVANPNLIPVIETFTTIGTTNWIVPADVTSVEYLLVGGGGGSGGGFDTGGGGGGGGGMVITGTKSVTSGEVYAIVVGDGGSGGISIRSPVSETNGSDGQSSEFGILVALGGGGGYASRRNSGVSSSGGTQAIPPNNASTGGSGGGSAGDNNGAGGGGGGSNGNGANGVSNFGGNGGTGTTLSISGASLTYGVGGNGANGNETSVAVPGTAHTGNGAKGGGALSSSQQNGAKGGSGIVILKYYV